MVNGGQIYGGAKFSRVNKFWESKMFGGQTNLRVQHLLGVTIFGGHYFSGVNVFWGAKMLSIFFLQEISPRST